MNEGKIIKVAGPLVVAEGMAGTRMYDVVAVSENRLIGEIIELKGSTAAIQVYEDTGGIGPGEPVYPSGQPLSVELGPGLIESIYDGLQRPLPMVESAAGSPFIIRGIEVDRLDRSRKWAWKPVAQASESVGPGQVIGTVPETPLVEHRVMVPPKMSGKLTEVKGEGEYTVEEVVAVLEDSDGKRHDLKMYHRWPVRQPRPFKKRLGVDQPLVTGQRVVDTFFPVGRGGTACVPGPFGSGKTVIQHQLAKWAEAEIIVYVGCGERGNEMTDVLLEFPELKDPRTGEALMKRSVLIANTSNMPVAAREASVYTGITLAEYFRDMGYSVALMADSTSRWAEAMREISGRLEEMPGEEGYPAYLGARIASFYERAGRIECLDGGNGSEPREGALTVIGAVSPPGGDLSDPVVQATLRVVKVFWSLEAELAYARHFPAVSWLNSYSLYVDDVREHFEKETGDDFTDLRREAMNLLEREDELKEIVRLVGVDALGPQDRLIMETSAMIRDDFLHQNAFHEVDTHTSLAKQYEILKVILSLHQRCREALDRGVEIDSLTGLPVRERIGRAKYLPEDKIEDIKSLIAEAEKEIAALMEK